MALAGEISTIFLIIRQQAGKHVTGLFSAINAALFVISYTFLRVFLFPFLPTGLIYTMYIYQIKRDIIPESIILTIIGTIILIALTIMIMFWYSIIIKSTIKLLKGKDSSADEEQRTDDMEMRHEKRGVPVGNGRYKP